MGKHRPVVVGDVVTLVVNVGEDFTGYDDLGLKFRNPVTGASFEKFVADGVAAYGADPASKKITYTTIAADLSVAGEWKIHPIVYQAATKAKPVHGEPAARLPVVDEFTN